MSGRLGLEGCADATPRALERPPIPQGPYLVAGLGRAALAAVQALRAIVGPDQVRAWDSDTSSGMRRIRHRLEAAGIRTYGGERLTRREVGKSRTLVKSPGVPVSAQVIQRALGKRLEVIDELELGWRLSRAPMLAVTGTNGKSTVCGLAATLLAARGYQVAVAGNTDFGAALSTVSAMPLDLIVCEVSSFQLEWSRCLLPEVALFTNLTLEHLGRHGTLERYGEIKRRMFINGERCAPRAIIDVDGAFGARLASDLERRGALVIRTGFSATADYRIESCEWDLRHAQTSVLTPTGRASLRTSLPGSYNARNIAGALALADLFGLERSVAASVVGGYPGVPGRFEHVDAGQPFDLIVDFAHTPDALEQLLRTIRAAMIPGGRLIVVFGLGGAPGTTMHQMGRVAAELADQLILTTSGLRGRPPIPALASTLAGARSSSNPRFEVMQDRRRAIASAVSRATVGDVVVIPGRGAYRELRTDPHGDPRPFDDRVVAREALDAAITSSSAAF